MWESQEAGFSEYVVCWCWLGMESDAHSKDRGMPSHTSGICCGRFCLLRPHYFFLGSFWQGVYKCCFLFQHTSAYLLLFFWNLFWKRAHPQPRVPFWRTYVRGIPGVGTRKKGGPGDALGDATTPPPPVAQNGAPSSPRKREKKIGKQKVASGAELLVRQMGWRVIGVGQFPHHSPA